jgi:putative ABC transport system permease protein
MDALIGSDRRVGIQSRFAQRAMLKDAKMILTILGGGLSLVLGAIGMLNFANVIMTGILVRRHELAVLKSIGMTRSQVNRMLVYECLWYAMLTTLLVTTLGSALTYGLFRIFKTQATYAVFSYPVQQMLFLLLMIFAICLVVPLMASRQVVGENVVESLRRSAV